MTYLKMKHCNSNYCEQFEIPYTDTVSKSAKLISDAIVDYAIHHDITDGRDFEIDDRDKNAGFRIIVSNNPCNNRYLISVADIYHGWQSGYKAFSQNTCIEFAKQLKYIICRYVFKLNDPDNIPAEPVYIANSHVRTASFADIFAE